MVLAFHQTELVCVWACVFVYTHPGPCVYIWIRSFFFFLLLPMWQEMDWSNSLVKITLFLQLKVCFSLACLILGVMTDYNIYPTIRCSQNVQSLNSKQIF